MIYRVEFPDDELENPEIRRRDEAIRRGGYSKENLIGLLRQDILSTGHNLRITREDGTSVEA